MKNNRQTSIHQAHDKLFKQALSHPEVIKALLKAHLPKELVEKADLSTLKLENNTFIDEAYKATAADIIYSVEIAGQRSYFIILLEHQSSIDRYMAFRLCVYQVRLTEEHRKRYPHLPLPIIYPIVMYSGTKPWDAPRNLCELYGEQAELARSLANQPYYLIDLTQYTYEQLQKQGIAGFVEFALQYKQYKADMERFCTLFLTWLDEVLTEVSPSFKNTMLHYLYRGIEGEAISRTLEEVTKQQSSKLQSELMTYAEHLIEKGRQEVMTYAEHLIEEGRREGLMRAQHLIEEERREGLMRAQHLVEEGKQESKLAIARNMLKAGLNRQMIQDLTNLSDLELSKLN